MMRRICHLFWLVAIQILITNQAECQSAIKSDSIYFWKYYSVIDQTVELKLRNRLIDIVYNGDKLLSQVSQMLNDGLWENNAKYINEYDNTGNQTLSINQLWKNGNWINYEKNEWKYDANGNEVERLNVVWKDNGWVNYSKSISEWNNANKIVSSTYLRWDGNYWINQSKSVTTYTDNGDESVHSNYVWVYGIWENVNRYSYLYNQDRQKIAYVDEFWHEHNWLKQDSNVYSYDASAFQSLNMRYHWDMVSKEWYLSGRTIFDYSLDYKNLVLTTQYGGGNYWENHHRDFFTVISNGAIMIDRSEEWDHEAWWPRRDIKRYYYDSTHMYIYVSKMWDRDNQLRSWDSTYWVPPFPAGNEENDLVSEKLFVFPNPSDGFFRVLTNMNPQSISVYNLKGEVVYKDYLVGRKSTDIDLRFLPAGFYNIDSFDGTQRRTAKIIIKQ